MAVQANRDINVVVFRESPVRTWDTVSKWAKFRMFCGRSLASPLLRRIPMRAGLTAWLLTSSACLVPQESRVLQPVPAAQNRPPTIVEQQALPARVVHTGNGAG